jgi:hypothetical protein
MKRTQVGAAVMVLSIGVVGASAQSADGVDFRKKSQNPVASFVTMEMRNVLVNGRDSRWRARYARLRGRGQFGRFDERPPWTR